MRNTILTVMFIFGLFTDQASAETRQLQITVDAKTGRTQEIACRDYRAGRYVFCKIQNEKIVITTTPDARYPMPLQIDCSGNKPVNEEAELTLYERGRGLSVRQCWTSHFSDPDDRSVCSFITLQADGSYEGCYR